MSLLESRYGQASLWSRLRRGLSSFRQAFFASGADISSASPGGDWDSYDARRLRYARFWSMYEGTAYDRSLHAWVDQLKVDNALYAEIRPVANPTYRLVEFWATHLMGGALDPGAGDGILIPSAIPIVGASAALRRSISKLWLDSRWQQQKTLWCRQGAAKGDVGLQTIDDRYRQRVYHRVVDPATIAAIDLDAVGNCQGYVLEEWRPDPRPDAIRGPDGTPRSVIYREEAIKESGVVRYATFLDDGSLEPYNWTDDPDGESQWDTDLPFVPFVLVNHNRLLPDSAWGAPEFFQGLARFQEADDLASRLSDYVAKTVDAPWAFFGVHEPRETPITLGRARSSTNPAPRRSEAPVLYGSAEGRAQSLVPPLSIAEVMQYLVEILNGLKEDYPEIRRDNEWSYGDASGRSLRVARQRVESKAIERRSGYDRALVQATQQAVAIGGERGYEGYEGFDFGSYAEGSLDFRVGPRSVFGHDVEDELDREKIFWSNASIAEQAGVPISYYLRQNGYGEDRIRALEKEQAEYLAKGMTVGRSRPAPPQPSGAGSQPAQEPQGGTAPSFQ